MDEIERVVIEAVTASAKAQKDAIHPQAALSDLGIDSLEFVVAVQTIEEALGILLPDDRTAEAGTVADLIEIGRRAPKRP